MDARLATPSGKPRARSLGIPFRGTPGANNAITDVPGVEVGYQTLIAGKDVRTGFPRFTRAAAGTRAIPWWRAFIPRMGTAK